MTISAPDQPTVSMAGAARQVHCRPVTQRSTHVQNLFVVRWGVPDAADRARIEHDVPHLHARAGRPLLYLAVMPADTPPLGDAERRLLMDMSDVVLPYCRRLIIVVEARGLRGAMLRSAMTAVSLLSRRRDTLRVVDSIEAAIELCGDELPELPMVRQVLREVGCGVLGPP